MSTHVRFADPQDRAAFVKLGTLTLFNDKARRENGKTNLIASLQACDKAGPGQGVIGRDEFELFSKVAASYRRYHGLRTLPATDGRYPVGKTEHYEYTDLKDWVNAAQERQRDFESFTSTGLTRPRLPAPECNIL